MKYIIVSNSYAPDRNARAFRWASLAEHWVANGHDVRVVTGSAPGRPDRENLNGVRVFRVGFSGLAAIRSRLAVSDRAAAMKPRPRRSVLRRLLKFLHGATWKKLYWPDATALWILPAARLCRELLRDEPADLLISVSHPFSGHVVGYLVRRRIPRLPWVVDIGDPFAFMIEGSSNNHRLYAKLNFLVESRVLSEANGVSVTTDGTLREYVAAFPSVASKIREIPPLVSLPPIPPAPIAPRERRLVYVGTMYRDVRGPELLLALFTRMLALSANSLELHLFGNHLAYEEVLGNLPGAIKDHVHIHGVVDRADALAAMQSAAALVNLGNDTTYQLPSKLVEYASLEVPIINVVSRPDDSSVAFLDRHPCVMNVVGPEAHSPEVAERVVAFLDAQRAAAGCAMDREWLGRFSLEAVSASYESLAAQAISAHSAA